MLLSNIAAQFISNDQIEKVRQFLQDNKNDYDTSKGLEQALVTAKNNVRWAEVNVPAIKKYLNGRNERGVASKTKAFVYLLLLACATTL